MTTEAEANKKRQPREARIIDGKQISVDMREGLMWEVEQLKQHHNLVPGLAVVLVGDDAASQVYVRNKEKSTKEVGMNSFGFVLPETISQQQLISKVQQLNNDPKVHGILVQLPLPPHLDEDEVISKIHPEKDVDGFHMDNVGKLAIGQDSLVPCTPQGCIILLKTVLKDLTGKNAIILGRSNIVGKPMAHLLLRENCTVTIAHSKTKDIEKLCSTQDIVIAAVGRPQMVKGDWIKSGAVVIDVGINRIKGENGKSKLVGDVDFEEACLRARAITPVPGGVGPMTIACLLANTIKAAKKQRGIK